MNRPGSESSVVNCQLSTVMVLLLTAGYSLALSIDNLSHDIPNGFYVYLYGCWIMFAGIISNRALIYGFGIAAVCLGFLVSVL